MFYDQVFEFKRGWEGGNFPIQIGIHVDFALTRFDYYYYLDEWVVELHLWVVLRTLNWWWWVSLFLMWPNMQNQERKKHNITRCRNALPIMVVIFSYHIKWCKLRFSGHFSALFCLSVSPSTGTDRKIPTIYFSFANHLPESSITRRSTRNGRTV